MKETWQLDHIAHAVRDIEAAINRYTSLFACTFECRETLAEHQVEVAFLKQANASIELITPLPGNTTLEKFIDARGESLHHVCFRVASIQDELKRLETAGVELIDKSPRPGARGCLVAFLHPQSCGGVLIELSN